MTKRKLPPGPELNAWVAENILGWAIEQNSRLEGFDFKGGETIADLRPIPRFSEDLTAAWLIVEKLQDRYGFQLEWVYGCSASFGGYWNFVEGETVPHTICLAAMQLLKSLNVPKL